MPSAEKDQKANSDKMRSFIRISHICSYPSALAIVRFKISFSTAPQKLYKECDEFLPWLQRKTGCEISSVLSVGFSNHGRALFALKSIRSGDCLLKVPYSAQISTGKIHPEIEACLVDDIDNVSRLAVVLLAEKKLGHVSEWTPYIHNLPHISEMHNTVFWIEEELDMLRTSTIYREIIDQKAHIEKEFLALKPALDHFPQTCGDVILEDFVHAYALITSRAWRTSKGISLIPFADFLNHDGTSEAVLLSDDIKETSEVVADRDYAAGEQVLIRYGKFPNATLMLDFGFTIPYNIHEQVQVQLDIPKHDPLYRLKLELLCKHCSPRNPGVIPLKSSESSFIIREVKSPKGKGKGIPQALRACARILSITSREELVALGNEAAKGDGRLARRPLKNRETELQAYHFLLSQFTQMIQDRAAAIKVLESEYTSDIKGSVRKMMAIDLLSGELRVLRSACAWLANYCTNLSASSVAEFSKN